MLITLGSIVSIILFWLCLGPWFARLFLVLPLPAVLSSYLSAISPSFAMALGVVVVSRLFLKTPLSSLVGPWNHKAYIISFVSYIAVMALCTVGKAFLFKGTIAYTAPSLSTYLLMLLVIILCNAIQCAAEEFTLRIIPSKLSSNTLVSSLLCTLCFLLPHLWNTEVSVGDTIAVIAYYAIFGFAATYICLKQGSFVYSLAIHMANNLFISLFCTYGASSLKTPALFQDTGKTGTWFDVLSLVLALGVSTLLLVKLAPAKKSSPSVR